jgi:hypothetical protein
MCGNEAIRITCLTGFKGGGCGTEFLEQGNIPILIADLVTLEHNAAFELTCGIIGR